MTACGAGRRDVKQGTNKKRTRRREQEETNPKPKANKTHKTARARSAYVHWFLSIPKSMTEEWGFHIFRNIYIARWEHKSCSWIPSEDSVCLSTSIALEQSISPIQEQKVVIATDREFHQNASNTLKLHSRTGLPKNFGFATSICIARRAR